MIAIDTSALVAYFAGASGADVDAVDDALAQSRALLPPVVLTELLSAPRLRPADAATFIAIPRVAVLDGYWERAGQLRAAVLRRRHKARLADVLVAQVCIDAGIPLITRDGDFRHFVSAGLQLAF